MFQLDPARPHLQMVQSNFGDISLLEIVQGAMLISSPLEQGPIIYWSATIWALVGGGLIISDALYQRAQLNREQKTKINP